MARLEFASRQAGAGEVKVIQKWIRAWPDDVGPDTSSVRRNPDNLELWKTPKEWNGTAGESGSGVAWERGSIPEGNASDSGVPLGGLVADKKASRPSETKVREKVINWWTWESI